MSQFLNAKAKKVVQKNFKPPVYILGLKYSLERRGQGKKKKKEFLLAEGLQVLKNGEQAGWGFPLPLSSPSFLILVTLVGVQACSASNLTEIQKRKSKILERESGILFIVFTKPRNNTTWGNIGIIPSTISGKIPRAA